MISLFGNINKKPLVGFGVVGTKTFTNSEFVLSDISPLLSLVAKPTAQLPFLGYSTRTTLFLFSTPRRDHNGVGGQRGGS